MIEHRILKQFLMEKYNFPEIEINNYIDYKNGVYVFFTFVDTDRESNSTVSYLELVLFLSKKVV